METRFTYKIVIPEEERRKFRNLAKSRGMTISGLLGQLIKREIAESEAIEKESIAFPYSDSIRNGTPAIGNQVR